MQLICLKSLEEVGPAQKGVGLAQCWLDHIGYNWDEYGGFCCACVGTLSKFDLNETIRGEA